MGKMDNENKVKILVFCGFKDIGWGDMKSGWWQSPDLVCFHWSEEKTYPDLDMNFYFKYAVPKLEEKLLWFIISIEHIETSCDYYVKITDFYLASPCKEYVGVSSDPAEAFGEALSKLIEVGK